MNTIYLDHAATTAISSEVRAAMAPFLEGEYGNPSSRHPMGVRAAEAVAKARGQVARAVGAREEQVTFTSGGTEANNLAVLGLARAYARKVGRHVIVGATEHPSVRDSTDALAEEGFEVERARLDATGNLDLEHLAGLLREDTVLVSHMLVNNEFGTVYPIAKLARLVRAQAPGARVHTDAVQGLGKLEISLGELGVHALSVSAHKVHGPKGSGALVLAEGVKPRPLVFGGQQEGGLRSGTLNVAGIVGLGASAELAARNQAAGAEHMRKMGTILREGLTRIEGARIVEPGGAGLGSPAICAVLLPGPPAEVWMHHLETYGVMTSVGSACQAHKKDISPALLAVGLDAEEARRVLRLSFSRTSTEADVHAALDALVELEAKLRQKTG